MLPSELHSGDKRWADEYLDFSCSLGLDYSAGVEQPDRLLEAARLERFIARALHAMDADFREVVVLRDIEGLTYAEVQEATGLEMGTVKSFRTCLFAMLK